jgi:tetratricopeptide (TPR) repeat protein
MKKLLLGLLTMLFVFQIAAAQDGKNAYKEAKKAKNAYDLDPQNNKAKLQEAVDAIEVALGDSEMASEQDAYLLKGEIYDEIARQVVVIEETGIGDLEELPQVTMPAVQAAEAYLTALKMAEKRREKKDPLKGLTSVQTNLSNLGIYAIRAPDYAAAYANFGIGLDVHQALKAEGEDSILDAEGQYDDQRYYAGLAALLNEDYDAAKTLYEQLAAENYDEAGIYEGLYTIEAESGAGPEVAYSYLEKGRELFPEDTQLLFAEINHYLKIGKLDVLTDKLQDAIEKEPTNVSLYTTTGNVYDQLFQKAYAAGETDKANEYFEKALKYFNEALEVEPTNSVAIYSIGALYFNRGAQMSQGLVELSNDFSKEGQKKYNELEAKVNGEFEKAMPWFQKAEIQDPNDVNTIIALKEMYARRGDFETSNEFKDRLETVQSGGTVEPYHEN